jgi:hypothetical protein
MLLPSVATVAVFVRLAPDQVEGLRLSSWLRAPNPGERPHVAHD